jgi:alpha/beta superfamily hydrolase
LPLLRFNSRGVGRSQGAFDHGHRRACPTPPQRSIGLQVSQSAKSRVPAGSPAFSFGAWIGMQLLMRRPESRGLPVGVAAMANRYDFSLPRALPVVGALIVHGSTRTASRRCARSVQKLVDKLKTQKGIHHRARRSSTAPTTSTRARSTN